MISILPAHLRAIHTTFPETEPKLFSGCCIGAFVLLFVLETALAADPQIEFIERYLTNQVTIHFNTDPHRSYTLQCYVGGNGGTWTNIYTVPPDPFPNHYVVVAPATNGSGFYRLAVTP